MGTALSLAAGNIRNKPRRLIQAIHTAIRNDSIVASITTAPLIQVSIVASSRSPPSGMARNAPILSVLKMQDLLCSEIQ